MDDLKQSVQGAVYEQKDPLLIYKFEDFKMFQVLISELNRNTTSFLIKSKIPEHDENEVRETQEPVRRSAQNLQENKDEMGSLLQGGGSARQSSGGGAQTQTQEPPKMQPRQSQNIIGRNERVSVQYPDGTVKKDVKFKTVEEDVNQNKCVLLED
jgi:preprotein translocase subunit SecA